MIKLDIQPYCECCDGFEPEVRRSDVLYAVGGEAIEVGEDMFVRCKYRKRCENMVRYLQRQMAKGESNDEH